MSKATLWLQVIFKAPKVKFNSEYSGYLFHIEEYQQLFVFDYYQGPWPALHTTLSMSYSHSQQNLTRISGHTHTHTPLLCLLIAASPPQSSCKVRICYIMRICVLIFHHWPGPNFHIGYKNNWSTSPLVSGLGVKGDEPWTWPGPVDVCWPLHRLINQNQSIDQLIGWLLEGVWLVWELCKERLNKCYPMELHSGNIAKIKNPLEFTDAEKKHPWFRHTTSRLL